jgi:chloramphenicol-sensitive protein RarD
MSSSVLRARPEGQAAMERSGTIAGVSAYVLWGLITMYWKVLQDFAPLELIGYRIVLSALLLAGVLTSRGRLKPMFLAVTRQRLWRRMALTAILLAINWTTYVVVVSEGKVIEAALGYFIAPLLTMLLGVKVLHERLRPMQLSSAIVAAIAVVVLTIGYGSVPFYALAMASTWALYGLLKRQIALQPLESLMSETVVLVVPAVLLMIWMSGFDDSVVNSASAGQLTLVLLTGVVTAVPLLLFAAAAQKLPLTVLGPMQYSVPVINFLLGWLVYHEKLTTTRVIGFGLIWVALVIVTIDSMARSRSSMRPLPSTS